MNALTPFPAAVQAEPAPHRFSVEDFYAMMKAGVIEEGDRQELIDGEVIDMAGDGPRTLAMTSAIFIWLARGIETARFRVFPNATLVLSKFNAPSPDWWVAPVTVPIADLRGPDALLVIEQSDTTLAGDLGRKARLYAAHGVRDYWVIDLERREVHVHRDPAEHGYGSITVITADAAVETLLIPGLTLCLDRLLPEEETT